MEDILEPVLTSFSLSLFLFVTSLLKKCVNALHWSCVMHITYLLHLQVMSVCCCSTARAVVQCACTILAVLYEQMRDFTLVRNWHWKCSPYLFHLFWSVSVKACTHAVIMAYLRPHHCMLFLSLCWFVLSMSLVVFSQGVSDIHPSSNVPKLHPKAEYFIISLMLSTYCLCQIFTRQKEIRHDNDMFGVWCVRPTTCTR